MLYTGEVRKIDADILHARLLNGEITLVPPLGYSPTGEMFNLTVESVAAAVAATLRADKLLFLLETGSRTRTATPARARGIRRGKACSARGTVADDIRLFLPPALAA